MDNIEEKAFKLISKRKTDKGGTTQLIKDLENYLKLNNINEEEVPIAFPITSILINYGSQFSDKQVLRISIDQINQVLKNKINKGIEYELRYNLAAAYIAIAQQANIWKSLDNYASFPENDYYYKGLKEYQNIWKSTARIETRAKAVCNLANALTYTGRIIEAIFILDELILEAPNFGMAHSMKYTFLMEYAEALYKIENTTDQLTYRKSLALGILYEVYHGFKSILKNSKLIDSIKQIGFDGVIENINNSITFLENNIDKTFLENNPIVGPAKIGGDKIDSYLTFISQNNLFLSYNFFNKLDGFGHDHSITPHIVTPILDLINDENILTQLNEIKECYIWATERLYSVTLENNDIYYNFIDSSAEYLDSPFLPGHNNGLKIKNLKAVIKESYDIFDKIIYLLNLYHNIGFNKPKWSAEDFWTTKNKTTGKRNFKPFLVKLKDPYLTSLYSLRKDMLNEGIYKNIKELRENITHSNLSIKQPVFTPVIKILDFKGISEIAFESLKLAKISILSMFMHFDIQASRNTKTISLQFPNQADSILNK